MALRTVTHPTTLKRLARTLPDNARGCRIQSADLDVEVRDGQLVIVGKGDSKSRTTSSCIAASPTVLSSDAFSLRTMSK